jgi:hypothetical protein
MITVISIVTLGLTAESFAQRGAMKWQGSGGWGMGTPYQRAYDPAKAETISGTVGRYDSVPMGHIIMSFHIV